MKLGMQEQVELDKGMEGEDLGLGQQRIKSWFM